MSFFFIERFCNKNLKILIILVIFFLNNFNLKKIKRTYIIILKRLVKYF